MPIAISGSLAYDYIMDFPGRFKDHILPEKLHILNVSFVVDRLEKSLGGCAGNIAHTVKLLGGAPLVFGAVGKDGGEYFEHLKRRKIPAGYVGMDKDLLTASAHIITDVDDNQVNGFFPGVPPRRTPSALRAKEAFGVAIVAPTHKEVMKRHIREFAARGTTVVFDPGQQITAFSGAELRSAIASADIVIGNDYEMKVLTTKSGLTERRLLEKGRMLVVTLGARGSVIKRGGSGALKIGACRPKKVLDPTGAGDAYRAGFLVGFDAGKDLVTCGRMGAVAASYAIETLGTQEHTFTKAAFWSRYHKTYG